ncbi:MAG: ATP-binding protein, partial [Candidatus Thermoplasmatota archaeon]|nr:ATP-binding protein [Candidatus Thermoplasmatota archaeon]
RSTSELRKGVISIVSILNKHQKGTLIFGISPEGKVVGQDVSEKTLRNVSEVIANRISPRIYPDIDKKTIHGKDCILVEFTGSEIPYYAYGRVYMRVSDQDKQLSPKEIERIILEQNQEAMRWDDKICKDASLEDIDEEKVRIFLDRSGKEYDENSLEKIDVVKGNRPTNTAMVLFGKEPRDFFPYASQLRCAVFGTDDTTTMIDMKDFEGDIFTLIEEAEKYILKNIHIGMRLDGLRRVDVPEINKDAFREAIINAFSHRDYWKKDTVKVAVFKDRVEVRSPGLLFGGLTIEAIRKGNISKRRNPLIADKFKDIHFVENWGRGIKKILKLEPETEFKEFVSSFITVFKRDISSKEGVVDKDTDKDTDKDVEKLTEKQINILKAIEKNNRISIKEMSKIIGINQRNIKINISKLKQQSYLKRIGTPKDGYWKTIGPYDGEHTVEGIGGVVNKDTDKDTNKDTYKDVEKLTENQIHILKAIEENHNISTKELSEQIGINHRNTKRNISELQRKGFLKRIGPAKGGHWKIIKKGS